MALSATTHHPLILFVTALWLVSAQAQTNPQNGHVVIHADTNGVLLIDGKEAGTVADGAYWDTDLSAGEHFIELRVSGRECHWETKILVQPGAQVAERTGYRAACGGSQLPEPQTAGITGASGIVEGFVTNTEGKPIKGAEVTFSYYGASHDSTLVIPYATKKQVGVVAVTSPPDSPIALSALSCVTDSNGQYKCLLPNGRYRPSVRLGSLHFVRGLSPQSIEVRSSETAGVSFNCDQRVKREVDVCHITSNPSTTVSATIVPAKPAKQPGKAKNALIETGPS